MRFIFLTLDGTHGAALRQAAAELQHKHGVELAISLYTVNSLRSEADWQRLTNDVASADFVFGALLFGEEVVRPLQGVLSAAQCPVCIITSNPALIRLTRLGKFILEPRAGDPDPGMLSQVIKKFKPRGGSGEGQRQLAVTRNLSKVLKYIPGKARDVQTYLAAIDFWLNCSPANLYRLLCMLLDRYMPGMAGKLPQQDPIRYPESAIYHPDAPAPFADTASYQAWRAGRTAAPASSAVGGAVGILSLRTVILSGNTAHLDALVRALEARGVEARVAYSGGLDFRPAIEQFFSKEHEPAEREAGWKGFFGLRRKAACADHHGASVDLLINGAGFSLIGGMAESRPEEARIALEDLDVGYLDMIPLAFQRVEDWQADDTGISPMQLAMNVAIPELDGAADPLIIGGPTAGRDMFVALDAQITFVAERVARRVTLHRTTNAEKRLAVVLFNFPPNLGNIGTAAYLDVFQSLFGLMTRLRAEGYDVEVPADVDALRRGLVEGNTLQYGTDGNLAARLPVADYMRLFPHYREIEPYWGKAPGELLNDGKSFFILGAQFGKLFVGLQPSFGYERDPMRLLMAKDAAPHHGFAAFYTWLDKVYRADALVHFGTHGALEFMPGKQAGLSAQCWPARLIGGLPHIYYYSVNNPSEATIAKRRGLATLVSYMVPPLQHAGLYKGLRLLKDSLDTYRSHPNAELLADIRTQAGRLEIAPEHPGEGDEDYVAALAHELMAVEQRMIPLGLHVLGASPAASELADMLALVAAFSQPDQALKPLPQVVAAGLGYDYEALREQLAHDHAAQQRWEQIEEICREALCRFVAGGDGGTHADEADAYLHHEANIVPGTLAKLWHFLDDLAGRTIGDLEMHGLMHALDGGYLPSGPGNDVVRNPAVLPTGRNIHGLDPYRVPTPVAQAAGSKLMKELLERLTHEQGALPETVAVVLWGTDNLKSDCEGVAQVLALLGVRTVSDELGKVVDVALLPLAELRRPRVDVVVTVSGIFRDLLHHQLLLLDKAVRLAAEADEPLEFNFVRKHALEQAQALGISLDEAATRVFANAPGSYGANINHLVESSTWDEDKQLGEAYLSRKSFAIGKHGQWREARAVMEQALATVDATFQNVDSFEVGISDIDYYYESLGGVTKTVELLRGKRPTVLVADAVSTTDRLGSLEQMVRLETRAKLLNPKWFEAMLSHGYEGVREIEDRVSNTYGWSATADAVEGWVYQGVADTFLLDEAMRERMSRLNPHAVTQMTQRLLEANDRGFWDADPATLAALQEIYSDLEDRLEGVGIEQAIAA